jgi:hypothetical protein
MLPFFPIPVLVLVFASVASINANPVRLPSVKGNTDELSFLCKIRNKKVPRAKRGSLRAVC